MGRLPPVTPEERLASLYAGLEDQGLACLVMGGHAVRHYGVDSDAPTLPRRGMDRRPDRTVGRDVAAQVRLGDPADEAADRASVSGNSRSMRRRLALTLPPPRASTDIAGGSDDRRARLPGQPSEFAPTHGCDDVLPSLA
jgi:hypothetical protein